ncbi:cytochrome P450 [Streptomyces sp. Q6]|uniref:Cytochrome P450 n=1 Tax=Streptomyces citrinus TaxID=3118173 RepID=A0ACD5AHL9_9ACTN
MSAARPGPAEAPHALPLLGHALHLWRRPLPFLRELPHHEGLVTLRLGPARAYLACGPEAVMTVLHDPRTFDKGGPLFEKARLLVGDGLVSSDFVTHRRQRLLMQPAFASARLPAHARPVAEETAATLADWHPGRTVDVGHEMHRLTLRIAARSLFGGQLGERAVAEVVDSMPVIMRGVYQRMLVPAGWAHRLPLPANRRFARARATLHRVIRDTVHAYREAGRDHGDVLSILVSSRDDHGDALSDQEIHDQVMTLMIGATEPPGDALTWVFHLLAAHPRIERALHAEIDDATRAHAGPLGPDALPNLELTRRVILETLRRYPPAWLLSRTVTRDTTLGGHRLARGATVLFSPYQLHHDPALFPDPLRFDPDRWLDPSPMSRAALLPFGAGNRKCIGDEVALTELTLVVAAVAARFRLRPVPGTVVRPLARASLGAGRVAMTVERRARGAVDHTARHEAVAS